MNSSVRLSHLLQQTASFMMKHFGLLLAAAGLPLIVSYGVIWITIGAAFNRIKQTSSFEDLVTLFSPSSTLAYTLVLVAILVLAINLIGWIGGPLITIEQDRIHWKNLLPRILKFFWSYFALSLIVIFAVVIIELAIFLLITIILTLVGFIDQAAIATAEDYLIIILPDVALFLVILSLMFAPYFLIDQQLTAWQAVVKSVGLVKRHFFTTVFNFLFIAMLILLISFMLAFIPLVGAVVAYLLGGIILTVYNYHLYRGLTSSEITQ